MYHKQRTSSTYNIHKVEDEFQWCNYCFCICEVTGHLDILKKRVHTKISMILPYCCLPSSSFCCPCCHHHLCHWGFSAGFLDFPALFSVLNRSETVWWSCLWRRSRVWLVEYMLASHRDQVVNIAKIKQSNKQQGIAVIHLSLNCTNFNKVKMSLILKDQSSKEVKETDV